ncbi:MAG: hypothetical protein J0G30_01040 [Actinomycetales bacterium]|nr:hypothetical protein [Actinomycetales bacterium]
MKTRNAVEIVTITLGVIALFGAALVGSSFLVPHGTAVGYEPGDGVSATVGGVDVEGIVVITEDGELGNLLLTAVNNSGDNVALTVQYPSGSGRSDVTLRVPAGRSVGAGYGDNPQLLLENIGTPAGGLIPLYLQYGSVPGVEVDVPVLDGSFAEYSGLLPTPEPTPTPTPTPAATAEPTATPTPAP